MPDAFKNLMPLLQLKQQREQNEQALSLKKLSNEIETYTSQMEALQGMKKDRQTKLDGLQEERADRLEKLQVLGVAFEKIQNAQTTTNVGGDSFKIGGITLDRYSKEFNSIEQEIKSTKADMEKMEILTNYFNKGQQTSLENYNTILGADKKLTDDDFGRALTLYAENHPEDIDEKTGKLKDEQAIRKGISKALVEREDQLSNIDYKKALKGQADRVARGDNKETDPLKVKREFFKDSLDNNRAKLGKLIDNKGIALDENRVAELKATQGYLEYGYEKLSNGEDVGTFEDYTMDNLSTKIEEEYNFKKRAYGKEKAWMFMKSMYGKELFQLKQYRKNKK